jgi:hypothetical protein
MGGNEIQDPPATRFSGAKAMEKNLVELTHPRGGVAVAVDERGRTSFPCRSITVRTGELIGSRVVADIGDGVAHDGQSGGLGAMHVHRVDAPVPEDEIGILAQGPRA